MNLFARVSREQYNVEMAKQNSVVQHGCNPLHEITEIAKQNSVTQYGYKSLRATVDKVKQTRNRFGDYIADSLGFPEEPSRDKDLKGQNNGDL